MVRIWAYLDRPVRRAPHPRGDGPCLTDIVPDASECSPPAWGWSGICLRSGIAPRVLPTRVGMVRAPSWGWLNGSCAPHPRGDGPYSSGNPPSIRQCSPPAWGWSVERETDYCVWIVLPTRVGMVRSRTAAAGRRYCAPHPRGDGPTYETKKGEVKECSPPAWGWSAALAA